jgi:uncharacterized protein (TIGR02444 family)
MPELESSPEAAFWRFSLAFYGAPGVAGALLALQDRDGVDVNLMLFALWLGISGRGRLDSDALAAARRVAGAMGAEIVEPLRMLRRRLKRNPDEDVQRLREGVKALELEGEKLAQRRLARLAGPALGQIPAEDRLAAALASLALYLGPQRACSAEAIVIRDALGQFMANGGWAFNAGPFRPSVSPFRCQD